MTLLRQILLGLALVAAVALYLVVTRHQLAAAEQRATIADTTAQGLRDQLAAAKTSERIVTQYVDRVQVIRERGATLTKEVPIYVPAQADAACTVPAGFVRLHNVAATGDLALPGAAGTAHASASGVALSTVAGTVVDNYATCAANAAQLTALQDWVRANQ